MGDWSGISFSELSLESVIENSIIEYGGGDGKALISISNTIGSRNDKGIIISGSGPLINNNILRNVKEEALRIQGDARITNNIIEGGRIWITFSNALFSGNKVSGKGFFIGPTLAQFGSSPTITKNDIVNNSDENPFGGEIGGGITINGEGSPIITYNNIVSNSNGIVFSQRGGCDNSNPIISYNNIYSNKGYSIIAPKNSRIVIAGSNNWWGTTDQSLIGASIYDQSDDFTLAKVEYASFASALITTAGR